MSYKIKKLLDLIQAMKKVFLAACKFSILSGEFKLLCQQASRIQGFLIF